jgi:hypothetical protein
MSTSASVPAAVPQVRAIRAWVERRKVRWELDDGREIGFPAHHFPRLKHAPDELLARVRIEARGTALRWEELDEDLSVDGILTGWRPGAGAE